MRLCSCTVLCNERQEEKKEEEMDDQRANGDRIPQVAVDCLPQERASWHPPVVMLHENGSPLGGYLAKRHNQANAGEGKITCSM